MSTPGQRLQGHTLLTRGGWQGLLRLNANSLQSCARDQNQKEQNHAPLARISQRHGAYAGVSRSEGRTQPAGGIVSDPTMLGHPEPQNRKPHAGIHGTCSIVQAFPGPCKFRKCQGIAFDSEGQDFRWSPGLAAIHYLRIQRSHSLPRHYIVVSQHLT